MKNIRTIEEWKEIEQILLKKGYDIFQTQYHTTCEEGYQVRFIRKGGIQYEIKTYDKKIEEEINKYST